MLMFIMKNIQNTISSKRIIIYYQTLISLQPLIQLLDTYQMTNTDQMTDQMPDTFYDYIKYLLNIEPQNTPLVTHITLASIHFGKNPDNSLYIHLNDNDPKNDKFTNVYKELEEIKQIKNTNININLLIGGAGSAFETLFSDYESYYSILKTTIENTLTFIDGFNLDIEEQVTLENVIKLVNDLKRDFPQKDIIFAPLSSSIATDEPGMGGFSYKDLDKAIGDQIAYYNVQCYGEYTADLFNQMVANGYKADKLVMGMLTGQDFASIETELNKLSNRSDFGGVAVWEYFNAPPDSPSEPYKWLEIMNKIMYQ